MTERAPLMGDEQTFSSVDAVAVKGNKFDMRGRNAIGIAISKLDLAGYSSLSVGFEVSYEGEPEQWHRVKQPGSDTDYVLTLSANINATTSPVSAGIGAFHEARHSSFPLRIGAPMVRLVVLMTGTSPVSPSNSEVRIRPVAL